jgi:hypothetical protein
MLAGSLQFGPKLALIRKGNAVETIRLNADRSVSNWPTAVKASGIANGIVISPDGSAFEASGRKLGTGITGASSDLGMLLKSDGTTQVSDIIGYHAMFQRLPATDQLKDVVAGAGEFASNQYFFLKRNGKVERWAWNDGDPASSLQLAKVLPVQNVVEVHYMYGSLPLAMLRRDGTVVTVDHSGAINDQMTYSSSVIVPRPPSVRDIVAVATGYAHVLALGKDGTVVAWGANSDHECDVPTGLQDVVSIAASAHMSYALTRNGQVTSWGSRR